MLKAVRNKYDGMFVAGEDLPAEPDLLLPALRASLTGWQAEGIKVVWIRLEAARGGLVPLLAAEGFDFHHCEARALMLVRRLQPEAHIPLAATHSIGVGAVVLSPRHEVLTVLEKRDIVARPGFYKLPGGMIEPGEFMAQGAEREVFEETGIRARFRSLLGFRHHHEGQFGASNIYAVCRLEPLSFDITPQEEEIGDARWMPVADFLADPVIGPFNKLLVQTALAGDPLSGVKIDGYHAAPDRYEIMLPAGR